MPVLRKVRATLGNCYRDKIRRDVPILAFHRIRKGDGTSLDTFRKVLDYVASTHRALTLGELGEMLRRGTRIPQNGIVLTFDDATLDQNTLAGPELNQRGLRATFGVIGCTLLVRWVSRNEWLGHRRRVTLCARSAYYGSRAHVYRGPRRRCGVDRRTVHG
ncbi:MAG: hypothetical protein IH989_01500 [Planctomycetes bacterium]|nr:hypothetical protein [Planctomycetota bacterium]